MSLWCFTLTILLVLFKFSNAEDLIEDQNFKGFDDTNLFSIEWPKITKFYFPDVSEQERIVVKTNDQEKYECYVPLILKEKHDNLDEPVSNWGPLNLIKNLFDFCSYRIESYWTYEVCHGKHVRQYHEERDGKVSTTQGYYLGKWNAKLTEELKAKKSKIKTKKIDGVNLPYFEIEMVDGTLCNLNNEPRVTKIQYVCLQNSKNDIYSLKETSTCNYEIVIITPILCLSPLYNVKEATENKIACLPLDGAPVQPKGLTNMEHKLFRLRQNDLQKILDENVVYKQIEINGINIETIENMITHKDKKLILKDSLDVVKSLDLTDPSKEFLKGDYCVSGGTGWWKYVFCYGRSVRQYHIDKIGGETSLTLGTFNEEIHRKYMSEHPEKRPRKKNPVQIIHYYSNGNICDRTGKHRDVEVVLKCMPNTNSMTKVTLYLLEPKTCSYVLGVESPIICQILNHVDEDGLFIDPKESTEKDINVLSEKSSESLESNKLSIDDDNGVHFQND